MNCKICHESKNRLRVHLKQKIMTFEEAYILENYLLRLEGVDRVKIHERTANAIIEFRAGRRDAIVEALSRFDYDCMPDYTPDASMRRMQRDFENKMLFHVMRRFISRLFIPAPVRMVITAVKSLPYFGKALKALAKGELNVAVLDAAGIGVSMLRGEFDTAGSVIFLLGVGDILEEWTHRKSVNDLARMMSLNVDKVWVVTPDGREQLESIAGVNQGDLVRIRTGGVIPLDGTVEEGEASVSQASITGESLPVHKSAGSSVYAGTVIEEGSLTIKVRNELGSGRYDRIVSMIEESEKMKSSAENKASNLADKLVPYTLGASALAYLVTRDFRRASSVLMVDFCCALKLSMPISVLSAMREAAEHHISVKGGKYLEAVSEAETIIFDKTGTLTHATPSVADIVTFNGYDKDQILTDAACIEEHYPHSIANAVVAAAAEKGLSHEERHSKVEYIVAHGIASVIDGKKFNIGSYHFVFEDEGCVIPEDKKELFDSLPDHYTHLYMSIDGVLSAVILIEDPLREEAAGTVRKLREQGFSKIVMMTGDSERTARVIADEVGVDEYHSAVLPEDKANYIKREHEAGRKAIMIGDGVNDSPALSEADVGVSISTGSAIAREVADITITSDDLNELITLRMLSRELMKRIRFNYRTILSFNSFLILMGVLGLFQPSMSALLHNASTILISLRSMTDLLDDQER